MLQNTSKNCKKVTNAMNTEKENRKISKPVSINLMIGAEFATELEKAIRILLIIM